MAEGIGASSGVVDASICAFMMTGCAGVGCCAMTSKVWYDLHNSLDAYVRLRRRLIVGLVMIVCECVSVQADIQLLLWSANGV
jgi:hypothetical protein